VRTPRLIWLRLLSIILLTASVAAMDIARASGTTGEGDRVRAMWIWRTDLLLEHAQERERLLEEAASLALTDVYLFLRADDYVAREQDLQSLLATLDGAGVRAWGMEGWRGYFSDADGPAGLYAAIDALVDFNARNGVGFVGFHSDLEPHDGQGEGRARFFNGLPSSELSPGMAAIREELLREWMTMHENLRATADANGILYGAAFPGWLDDYYGEPLIVTIDGSSKPLLAHLMPLVAQHVVMSYNTSPENVIERVRGEFEHGDVLGVPRVMFALEVHPGAGKNVSYANTPGRNSRAAVLSDIAMVERVLKDRPSYLGWSIHDWRGWAQLPP
jgi:hypothetical protein